MGSPADDQDNACSLYTCVYYIYICTLRCGERLAPTRRLTTPPRLFHPALDLSATYRYIYLYTELPASRTRGHRRKKLSAPARESPNRRCIKLGKRPEILTPPIALSIAADACLFFLGSSKDLSLYNTVPRELSRARVPGRCDNGCVQAPAALFSSFESSSLRHPRLTHIDMCVCVGVEEPRRALVIFFFFFTHV